MQILNEDVRLVHLLTLGRLVAVLPHQTHRLTVQDVVVDRVKGSVSCGTAARRGQSLFRGFVKRSRS